MDSILAQYFSGDINAKGEQAIHCPYHIDRTPSAHINPEKEVWHCKSCGRFGKIKQLLSDIKHGKAEEGSRLSATFAPNIPRDKIKSNGKSAFPSLGKIAGWSSNLLDSQEPLDYILNHRGLSREVIKQYSIGWNSNGVDGGRFTIPIIENGELVNVRMYSPTAKNKMLNVSGHGEIRLFPKSSLEADDIILCEGEWDAIIAGLHSFNAISATGGAGSWRQEWTALFSGKNVSVVYDTDEAGILGARKVAGIISKVANRVAVIDLGIDKDLTDWFVKYEKTSYELEELINSATPLPSTSVQRNETITALISDSMKPAEAGSTIRLAAQVIGKKQPAYTLPFKGFLSCSMNAGNKCALCPVSSKGGNYDLQFDSKDVDLYSQFIDAPKDSRTSLIMRKIDAPRCTLVNWVTENDIAVEEIFVSGDVRGLLKDEISDDNSQRRVYSVGTHNIKVNQPIILHGAVVPDPKNGRNELLAWDIQEAISSIDKFDFGKELVDQLGIFQVDYGQSPIEKCEDIADDLSHYVTHIFGRNDMVIAMDLAFHSAVQIQYGPGVMRGWVELLVIGDTRTGKSETATRLIDHYQLGHMVGTESATFPGLVGGVKQIGTSWVVQWGSITINDRRLVVLDECNGMSHALIGQLSDVRSRGIAQITKIETHQTTARTRKIWIANPRTQELSGADGIFLIKDLIGNPEDISRFDLAMSVRSDDVSWDTIQKNLEKKTSQDKGAIYTSELCRNLLLWAWSRKVNDIVITKSAEKKIIEKVAWLGSLFCETPPLIQVANVREKIARLSVALAARVFSTDKTGHKVVVNAEHVTDSVDFLYRIYSQPNFGYLQVSKAQLDRKRIAQSKHDEVKEFLASNASLSDFLSSRSGESFRMNDIEEYTGWDREFVKHAMNVLSQSHMIRKEKAQNYFEPELTKVLRELNETT